MTLLVQLEAGRRYKARLCLRGDLESLMKVSFASVPTVSREMLMIMMSILVNSHGFKCASLDISQAFIQADEVAVSDQIVGTPPGCIRLEGIHWDGQLLMNSKTLEVEEMMRPHGQTANFLLGDESQEHQAVKTRIISASGHGPYGFLIRRPLYGARRAPPSTVGKIVISHEKGGYVQTGGMFALLPEEGRGEKMITD